MSKNNAKKISNAIAETWAAHLDEQVFRYFKLRSKTEYNLFAGMFGAYVTSFNPKIKDKNRLKKARAFVEGYMEGLSLAQKVIGETK